MISPPTRVLLGSLVFILYGAGAATAQSTPSPEISLTGSLSSRIIRNDEHVQFTLNIKNKADAKNAPGGSVQQLQLLRLPDDYTLDENQSICVLPLLPPHHETCQTYQNFPVPDNVLADSLAPGDSLIVQGYLKPGRVHKTATLTVVVGWTSSKGGAKSPAVPSAQSVSLGENQVQSASWKRRLSSDELMKILAVPAVLLLVGAMTTIVVNFVNVWRERRIAKAQAAADAASHEREQERAVRAETWKQMLPVSHNYAAKFYLPLSLAAERFAKSLKKSNARLAFFYLLFSGKKAIATRNEIGGFYFKDLRGETLAAQCWEQQRLACLGEEDTPFFLAVRASIDQLQDIDSYEAFVKMFADESGGVVSFSDNDIETAWTLFQKWMGEAEDVAKTIQFLEGFYAVLDFESNRPYEYWYDTPAQLKITEPTQQMLAEILKAEKYTDKQIKEYFRAVVQP
jgi:hypothetical protein